MDEVVIVGGGALGRVLYDFISPKFKIRAFVDDNPKKCKVGCSIPVIGFEDIENLELSDAKFLLAVLNPNNRETIVNKLIKKGRKFSTYVDSTSFVAPSSKIGVGSTLLPNSFVMNSAMVRDYVHIHFNSAVGHDVVVGEFCSIAPNCIIGGYSKIGKKVSLGMGAKILPKITINDYVTIGAGAVVTKDVPEGATVIGNPAKIRK